MTVLTEREAIKGIVLFTWLWVVWQMAEQLICSHFGGILKSRHLVFSVSYLLVSIEIAFLFLNVKLNILKSNYHYYKLTVPAQTLLLTIVYTNTRVKDISGDQGNDLFD